MTPKHYVLLLITFVLVTLSIAVPVSHSEKGDQYLDKGAYELAVQEYKSALQEEPTNRGVYKSLGNAYRLLKDYSSAIESYRKFVSLSNEHQDPEGVKCLLEVASIYELNLHDVAIALKTYEGILEYYYPESLEPIDAIINKYRDVFTTPWFDDLWLKAITGKASLELQLNRKKDAFDTYSKAFALLKYKYGMRSPDNSLSGQWTRLYLDNISRNVPEVLGKFPWIVYLTADKPGYTITSSETKYMVDAMNIDKGNGFYDYIFEAPKGLWISRVELSADIDASFDSPSPDGRYSYPFSYEGMAPNLLSPETFGLPSFQKKGKQTVTGRFNSKTGVHAIKLRIWYKRQEAQTLRWSIKAGLTEEQTSPESTSKPRREDIKYLTSGPYAYLTVDVFPHGVTDFSLDSGAYEVKGTNILNLGNYNLKNGTHLLEIQRKGFPKKELKFYWDETTNQQYDFFYWTQWEKQTTNLQFPTSTKQIRLLKDTNKMYRLMAVVESEGQSDIYSSSSPDLVKWSPLEKLSVNGWMDDRDIVFLQSPLTGTFHLFWRSNRSSWDKKSNNSDLWESTSDDFIHWTRPSKIVSEIYFTPHHQIGYDLLQTSNGKFVLYFNGMVKTSDDGKAWSSTTTSNFELPSPMTYPTYYYQLLPNNKFLALYNEFQSTTYFFQSDDSRTFKKSGEMFIEDDQLRYGNNYQVFPIGEEGYALLMNRGDQIYLTKTKDWNSWGPLHEIVPYAKYGKSINSNIIRDDKGNYLLLRGEGTLWSTKILE